MICAVLDRRAGAPIGGSDAYLSTVGGVRLTEPASDLAVALAVASSVSDTPLGTGTMAIGEVGLAGEVRPTTGVTRRLAEAARLGFTTAYVPTGTVGSGPVARLGPRRRGPGRAVGRVAGAVRVALRVAQTQQNRDVHWTAPSGGRPGPVVRLRTKMLARGGRPHRAEGPFVQLTDEELFRATLAAVAPGTQLRDGLERILRGNTGALIVLGHDRGMDQLCTGGFPLEIEFSATRLRELAKMDGAIVVDRDVTRIVRAATQLVPDPSIETTESGTRHRTAERVSKQTGLPVVSVSQSMQIIALYVAGRRHVLEESTAILSHANQALQTLERYKSRLDEVTGTLSALEIEDLVTIRDVASVLQRLEMVRRISAEISGYVVELGVDGRLLTLQLEELTAGLSNDLEWVILDYIDDSRSGLTVEQAVDNLLALDSTELVDQAACARALGFTIVGDISTRRSAHSDIACSARSLGSRGPSSVGSWSTSGGRHDLLAANIEDLMRVEGVGEGRARIVREGLSRLAETSILEASRMSAPPLPRHAPRGRPRACPGVVRLERARPPLARPGVLAVGRVRLGDHGSADAALVRRAGLATLDGPVARARSTRRRGTG